MCAICYLFRKLLDMTVLFLLFLYRYGRNRLKKMENVIYIILNIALERRVIVKET
jgi:hypothetical protein